MGFRDGERIRATEYQEIQEGEGGKIVKIPEGAEVSVVGNYPAEGKNLETGQESDWILVGYQGDEVMVNAAHFQRLSS